MGSYTFFILLTTKALRPPGIQPPPQGKVSKTGVTSVFFVQALVMLCIYITSV